ncbi:tctex1 domain-containing protein 2 [Cricetulus griseus]|nr:tctex1 domain-containing protein 2 [Cricetulus griseus]
MAVSTRLSIGTSDALYESEKNTGEPENTYILRPVFQQRRVADGTQRAMSVGSGTLALERRQGDAERGGAGRAFAFRRGDFSLSELCSGIGSSFLEPYVGVVDLSGALGDVHGGQEKQRFRPSVVKDCIHAVLKEELASAEYSPDEMPHLTKHLSETIKDKLKELGYDRYKMVVQVVIGEQRGEGVFMAARCFWDADTDNYTHDVFMNDSLFCVVAAFGCFYY